MKSSLKKRLSGSIATVIVLIICLTITSIALAYEAVQVGNNVYRTGNVAVNLNDDRPIIRENEYVFEPGMTVEKSFFIKNESSCSVYYRLYFENVKGALADVLDVTIKKGDVVLYSGKPSELALKLDSISDNVLQIDEKLELTIVFYYPELAGNAGQGGYLSFDLAADVVQTKNNDAKEF